MQSSEISDDIKKNFHLFWDNFPCAVLLVHKDRTIIEINKAAKDVGYPVGIRCVDMGEKKHHAGCKANEALRDQKGVREVGYYDFLGRVLDSYWIPLAGAEDLYVHMGIDITEYASEKLLPKKCESGSDCGCSCG